MNYKLNILSKKYLLVITSIFITNCFQEKSNELIGSEKERPDKSSNIAEVTTVESTDRPEFVPISEGGLEIVSMFSSPDSIEDNGESVITVETNRTGNFGYSWYSDVGYLYGAKDNTVNFVAIGCCGSYRALESVPGLGTSKCTTRICIN